MNDIIYDIESFPNFFCVWFMHAKWGNCWYFEISDRRNDAHELWKFLFELTDCTRGVGFNNVGYDYPMLHEFLTTSRDYVTAAVMYAKSQQIIGNNSPWGASVAPYAVIWRQLDLYKIHHFDNKAKRTSLKALQFNMRMRSIEESPVPFGSVLTFNQMSETAAYCFHDVTSTVDFYWRSKALIDLRDELSIKYEKDFTNFNDTKIGKEYFIMRLEEAAPGICYISEGGRKVARQTRRTTIALADVIFPYIQFQHPEFNRIKDWMVKQVVDGENIKGFFKASEVEPDEDDTADVIPGRHIVKKKTKVSCTIDGFTFYFGKGGIHGSVNNRSFYANDEWCILDIDVSGFYPDIAIQNRVYPRHLEELFCDIAADNVRLRKLFAKGTVENAVFKLANNGVYGDTGNPYSPFYDTQYLLTITVNGQLLLCMAAEQILRVPSVELIQVNTDGMTIRVRRDQLPNIKAMCDWWQQTTKLTLEQAFYSRMHIRDVNSYLAVTEGSKPKIKRKNAYSWVVGPNLGDGELAWHQDHSALIIPMAAEAHMLRGIDAAQFIYAHNDAFDFMMRAKAPNGSKLMLRDGTMLPKVTRYYISVDGQELLKHMSARGTVGEFKRKNGLDDAEFNRIEQEIGGSHVWDARIHTGNRSKYDTREIGIDVGFKVTPAQTIHDTRTPPNINYNYYISKARELITWAGYQ